MAKTSVGSFLKRLCVGLVALAGAVGLGFSCSPPGPEKSDNVVLVIVDTLRPDFLGCYGFQQPTSPNIDALASEGILFEQAVTCSPVTLPSITAMMTSTYPVSNNVRFNSNFRVADASITLAEIMKGHGYRTAAFIGAYPLISRQNLNQGFDVYDDDISDSSKECGERIEQPDKEPIERTAFDVNERAFAWLDEVKDEPFFLMVHYFDPHWPYEPCAPYEGRFNHPYLGEIAYTDAQIGNLFDKLRQLGLKDSTLIVLTADHGEALGAHDEVTHGWYIFDATVRIPLIISHPGRRPEGRRIDTMVRSIDIMPTILDFLDIPDSPHTQGTSLLPALDGRLEERPVLLETMLLYYKAEKKGVPPTTRTGLRTSEWKLVSATWEEDGEPRRTDELYHLAKDPLELFNVADENPDTFARLMGEMEGMVQAYSNQDVPKGSIIEMDAETVKNLKALGYLQ